MITKLTIVFVIAALFNDVHAMHGFRLNTTSLVAHRLNTAGLLNQSNIRASKSIPFSKMLITRSFAQNIQSSLPKFIEKQTQSKKSNTSQTATRIGSATAIMALPVLNRDDNNPDENIDAHVKNCCRSCLTTAIKNGHNDTVRFFFKHCDFDRETLDDAFTTAAYEGNKETIEMLIAQRAHHNVSKKCLGTSLVAAARAGYKEIVSSLLEAKIDPDTQSFCGEFALLVVKDSAIAKLLLDHGANANIQNPHNGATPLKQVVYRNDLKMAKLFLTYGAQVSAQDDCGVTPLEIAAWRGYTDLVTLFLASPKIQIDDINATLLTLKHHRMSSKSRTDEERSYVPRREITEALTNKQSELKGT